MNIECCCLSSALKEPLNAAGTSRKCGNVNRHSGKCDSKRQVNAFWKTSPVFEYHKKRQILEEGLSNLQVRESALFKKEDVSSLQRQTEALLKEPGKIRGQSGQILVNSEKNLSRLNSSPSIIFDNRGFVSD